MDLNTVVPNKTVDARSMGCPGPLLEAKKAIGSITVGQILEVQSGDKGTLEDIPAWCKKTGQEYLGHISKAGYDSLYIIRKK